MFKLLSDRCECGGDRSRCTEIPPDTGHRTIRVTSLRMTPVDLPYVPILLNETFGSGEIFHIRGGLSQIFFVSTTSKDER
ncbi:hypothetical protein TNCV_4171211 [Trichonephila clavipes]|nr:hypothetical protein TNCV_4171211 [Trichonephila clavipes]